MALRGPVGPKDQVGPPAREQASSPARRLMDFGAATTPMEARRIIESLLLTLRAAGFPVASAGSVEGQLREALALFQASRGLPAHGELDRATHEALTDSGYLERGAVEATPAQAEPPARFDLEPRLPLMPSSFVGRDGAGELGADAVESRRSLQTMVIEARVERDGEQRPSLSELGRVLTSLRAAGFSGGGRGAEQLKDALRQLQRAEQLPQSGVFDEATVEALVRLGILEGPASSSPPPARAPAAADGAAPKEHAERGEIERAEPGRALVDEQNLEASGSALAMPSFVYSKSAKAGSRHGAEDKQDPWRQGFDGNAPAGDEDRQDERRGHANRDDGLEREQGHWQVPALSDQIDTALAAIVRDDDGAGAATYAWEVTLLRPGIYGAWQPAERLFHLVVARAGAFDPVWWEALTALNDKLATWEPDSPVVTAEQIARALRIARVRSRDLNDDG